MTAPARGRRDNPVIFPTWEPTPWARDAACRNHPTPALFFPSRGEDSEPAKEICRGCMVRTQCLEFALTTGIKYGIWGGHSEKQRREMRWQRQRERRTA